MKKKTELELAQDRVATFLKVETASVIFDKNLTAEQRNTIILHLGKELRGYLAYRFMQCSKL